MWKDIFSVENILTFKYKLLWHSSFRDHSLLDSTSPVQETMNSWFMWAYMSKSVQIDCLNDKGFRYTHSFGSWEIQVILVIIQERSSFRSLLGLFLIKINHICLIILSSVILSSKEWLCILALKVHCNFLGLHCNLSKIGKGDAVNKNDSIFKT